METTCNDSPFSTPSASPGPARNPSPPSEELLSGEDRSKLLEADTIQNTVFSKHWVFAILMKLLKHVESEPKAGQSADEGADGASNARDDGIDIDEELENDLCHLWDMTANVEICIGVLGNMACCPAIRQEFSKNQQLVNERPNTLSLLHHSLQVISTTEAGVDGLVELSEKVLPLVTSFISSVFDEGILATRGRENTLASVISVLSVMALRSKNVSRILSETENGTLKQLSEMLYVIHRKDTTSRKASVDGSSLSEAIHKDADAANQEQNSNADTTNSEQNGKSLDVVLGKVVGCHGDNGNGDDGADNDDEEEEEDPEKVWLTELLKDRLIDFFCCVLEVAKKCKALQTKLHTCGSARLSSLRECLPDDRNDLIDLIDGL